MKKDLLVIGGLIVLIVALLFVNRANNVFVRDLAPQAVSSTQVKINSLQITAEVAKTPQTRAKGLSQKESLPPNAGMLFVFEKTGEYGFWMKDVKFPLDLIWIDEDKQIADITNNALPEPEVPDQLLRIYKSAVPIRYVLEVFGGTARFHNLKVGDPVEFSL